MPINDIIVPPFTEGQKQIIEMAEKLAEKGKICDVDGIDDDIKDVKELLEDTIQKTETQKPKCLCHDCAFWSEEDGCMEALCNE